MAAKNVGAHLMDTAGAGEAAEARTDLEGCMSPYGEGREAGAGFQLTKLAGLLRPFWLLATAACLPWKLLPASLKHPTSLSSVSTKNKAPNPRLRSS